MDIILLILISLLGVYTGSCIFSIVCTDVLKKEIKDKLRLEGYDIPQTELKFSLKSLTSYFKNHALSFYPVLNLIGTIDILKKRQAFISEAVADYMAENPLVTVLPREEEFEDHTIETPFGTVHIHAVRMNSDLPPEMPTIFKIMNGISQKPSDSIIVQDEKGEFVEERSYDDMSMEEKIDYLRAQKVIIEECRPSQEVTYEALNEEDFTIK